jgi:hypothetical protein
MGLQDDLLKEFREEKELIDRQLALLDPLAVSLRKPIAARLLNSFVLLVLEGLCWLAMSATITFCVVRDKIYPFHILARLRVKGGALGFAPSEIDALYYVIVVVAVLICLLLFIIARNLSKLRRKNAILQLAGVQIKSLVGEQLERKAAIEAIDQRHFGILSPMPMSESQPLKSTSIPNPGF